MLTYCPVSNIPAHFGWIKSCGCTTTASEQATQNQNVCCFANIFCKLRCSSFSPKSQVFSGDPVITMSKHIARLVIFPQILAQKNPAVAPLPAKLRRYKADAEICHKRWHMYNIFTAATVFGYLSLSFGFL